MASSRYTVTFRQVISLATLLFSCRPASLSYAHEQKREDGRPPNFIVLFADDLGYGDVGFNGHPSITTPNLDALAKNGKILTTWYSGCMVCTGSRAALMTGRQWPRTGLPGVLGPGSRIGLSLDDTTIAEHLKEGNYTTAAVGKWHLGDRKVHLPGNRGFDFYLGVPYSDDMGDGIASTCDDASSTTTETRTEPLRHADVTTSTEDDIWSVKLYEELGLTHASTSGSSSFSEVQDDPAAKWLPLIHQQGDQTRILEQPLDFTTLSQRYNDFAVDFIEKHKDRPFFLYVPFSHVHTTSKTQPEKQYAGCSFRDSTKRGSFGDALAEVDWMIGNVVETLRKSKIDEETLIIFTSDNGPWLMQQLSGGSEGLFTGRSSGYWSTGKGSNWEGGIRMPAFAYWPGKIEPFTRSSEVISSMDVFPTLSRLAGLTLPVNRTFDGRDMSDILLTEDGKSKHDFLFIYGNCENGTYVSLEAMRHEQYKAYWCTRPGLGQQEGVQNLTRHYNPPLLFDVDRDPSESMPISANTEPSNPKDAAAMKRIMRAYAMEKATFEFGTITPEPDGPDEGTDKYGLCCDRERDCYCRDQKPDHMAAGGILSLGTKHHHERYHQYLGEAEPLPPTTRAQTLLHEQ